MADIDIAGALDGLGTLVDKILDIFKNKRPIVKFCLCLILIALGIGFYLLFASIKLPHGFLERLVVIGISVLSAMFSFLALYGVIILFIWLAKKLKAQF